MKIKNVPLCYAAPLDLWLWGKASLRSTKQIVAASFSSFFASLHQWAAGKRRRLEPELIHQLKSLKRCEQKVPSHCLQQRCHSCRKSSLQKYFWLQQTHFVFLSWFWQTVFPLSLAIAFKIWLEGKIRKHNFQTGCYSCWLTIFSLPGFAIVISELLD